MRRVVAVFLLTVPASADDFAPMALNSFTAAPARIASATVYLQDGSVLGNIQGFQRSPATITSISIGVSEGRTISLPASDASYDAVRNVVVTDMSATTAALGAKAPP